MKLPALAHLHSAPLCTAPLGKHSHAKFLLPFTEGYLTSCTFDYLTDTFDTKLFVAVLFTFSYCIPMSLIIYYYSQIVKHVFSHEKQLRAQAKKMNVESLRSNQKGAGSVSAEVRIAKAAITICFLFVACKQEKTIFFVMVKMFLVFFLNGFVNRVAQRDFLIILFDNEKHGLLTGQWRWSAASEIR